MSLRQEHRYGTRANSSGFQTRGPEREDERDDHCADQNMLRVQREENPTPPPRTRQQKKALQQEAAPNPMTYFIEEGRAIGLKETELRDYVREEKERQERISEKERQERIAEREREERIAEREFQDRQEERELERLRLQVELAKEGNTNNNRDPNPTRIKDEFRPRIPCLEDKDDIESWFQQYEHYAQELKLTEEEKSTRIIYFLKGKARTLYARMKEEEREDYDTVKATLFEGFQLTAEEYRKKFRQSRKTATETYKELIVRLERYLNKWIQLSEAEGTVEALKDLILKEQTLEILPPDLTVYVKDRCPRDTADIITMVHTYEQARSGTRPTGIRHGGGKQNHSKPLKLEGQNQIGGDKSSFSRGHHHQQQLNRSTLSEKEKEDLKKKGACFRCRNTGHISRDCPRKRTGTRENVGCASSTEIKQGTDVQPLYVVSCPNCNGQSCAVQTNQKVIIRGKLDKLCTTCQAKKFNNVVKVRVDGKETTALRDTGCTGIIVSAALVTEDKFISKTLETTLASKDVKTRLRVAVVEIDSPYFQGPTEVSVMEQPLFPVMIGQSFGVGNVRCVTPLYPVRDPEWYHNSTAAVTTRQQTRKEIVEEQAKPEAEPRRPTGAEIFSPADLKREQAADPSLFKVRQFAREGKEVHGVLYLYKKDILLRVVTDKTGTKHSKVVVPKKMRARVLSFGHDHAMAGHLGFNKTAERIRAEFWWPGFLTEIKRYCASCDTCQRVQPKGRTPKVPLCKVATIDVMFKKVAADIIGPIIPMSDSKKQYILVVVDYGTRYPEAIALKDIKAKTIAEALWEMWTRLGIPDQIVTDQGRQFTGTLMREVNEFLRIKHSVTAPFHPQANGLVEKFNGTLKSMMKKMALEQPKKWDTFIPALLFAYREAPQESTGFSPFEMLYGKRVKGPMQILRETWTQEELTGEVKTSAQYVVDLRNKIEQTCELAKENLSKANQRQARYFNKRTKERVLKIGQEVLLLLPTKHNKLELTWKGPFRVIEQINEMDYRIQMGHKSKVFHINLMKEYLGRQTSASIITEEDRAEEADQITEGRSEHCAVVVEEETDISSTFEEQKSELPLPYLGHEVGGGKKWPEADKVEKIQKATLPRTKKELRSFLGLCGFYRSYIEGYSKIATPLTDMTKKVHPEKLCWSEAAQTNFETLKKRICSKPILCMPDYNKEFVLRTDAADTAIGAILLQEHENVLKPIAYQSRKLNGAERRYSTVEKECLATVWGVRKFERYLYGKHFVLETDHQPLKSLQRNPSNSRLMRWSLQLQPYSFTVRYIPGKENHGADYLSRASYNE